MVKFTKPQEVIKVPASKIFGERLRRINQQFSALGFSYSPDDYITRRKDGIERANVRLQEMHPECVRKKLVNLTRVLLPQANMFELDEKGNLDKDRKVESCLVYTVSVDVLNPDDVRNGLEHTGNVVETSDGGGTCSFRVGVYKAMVPQYTRDKNGNITDGRIKHFVNRFYVKDSPKAIDDLIKEYGMPKQQFGVCVASERGTSYVENEIKYAVYNFEEFKNAEILDLIGASKKSLLSEHEGGVKTWLKRKEVEKELIQSGSATQKELDDLTKEDWIDVIESKRKKKKLVVAKSK